MPSPHDQEEPTARFASGSIPRHLVAQTLPMIIGVAAIMSVGLVDAYFIGRLGARELAAVSFIFPVSMALSSLGVGVIAGISSVVSRAIGAGEGERARDVATLGITISGLFGLIVGVSLFFLRGPLFRLMEADAELLPLIDLYMKPFSFAFPLLLFLLGISGALRGQGAARRAAAILLTYAGVNVALNPVLVLGGFGWEGLGIAGAAYATIAGWFSGGLLAFVLLQHSQLPFHPRGLGRTPWRRELAALGRVAGPAAFSNAINPLGLAVLTGLVATQGQASVAGFGAGGRLQTFAVVPLLGLSSSIGAIVGQNWGAKAYDRVREAMLWSAGFCLVYGLVAAVVLFFSRDALGAFFADDPAIKQSLAAYLAIAVWGYAAYGVQIVANGAFNAVDRATTALVQSVGRVLLVMIPVAWLLRGSWGESGIFVGELAANLVGGLVAVGFAWRIFWIDAPRLAKASPGSPASHSG
jgi:putative MATE family efflux protein